jgi:hypothetical protein
MFSIEKLKKSFEVSKKRKGNVIELTLPLSDNTRLTSSFVLENKRLFKAKFVDNRYIKDETKEIKNMKELYQYFVDTFSFIENIEKEIKKIEEA